MSLEKLEKKRVFIVRETPNGKYHFQDGSDGAFSCELDHDELVALSLELMRIADGYEPLPKLGEEDDLD